MTELYQRAVADLDHAERQLRTISERTARDLRNILIELAFRFAGERLEVLRRSDPNVPEAWSPTQWRDFWNNIRIQGECAWEQGGISYSITQAQQNEIDQLRRSLASTQVSAEAAKVSEEKTRQEANNLRQQLKGLSDQKNLSDHGVSVQKEPTDRPGTIAKELPAIPSSSQKINRQKAALSPFYQRIVDDLAKLVIPHPPSRFETRLGIKESTLRYRRKVLILYTIAKYGFSTRLEVDRLASEVEGIGARSNSIKKPAEELVEKGLLFGETLAMQKPFQTSLALYRLSEDGKALCQLYGWEPVESEWQRLIEKHRGNENREHALAILAFGMHARLRGWEVKVLPEVEGPAAPDVAVEKDKKQYYVEVERGDGSPEKWRNLSSINPEKKVAICACSHAERSRLMNDCKLLELSGMATDLASLIFSDPEMKEPRSICEIDPSEDLWLETW